MVQFPVFGDNVNLLWECEKKRKKREVKYLGSAGQLEPEFTSVVTGLMVGS